MNKPTTNNHTINDLIKHRWSPRAFGDKPVEKEQLLSLLEAARWAPSAFNEQPWRFMVGIKGDQTHASIISSLVEWNQKWASSAPVLILNLAKKTFALNGKQNVTFKYDLGQAVAFMSLEAVNLGLVSHQMSGFNPDMAAKLFDIPEDFQPVSVTAIGYYGDASSLPTDMAKMEMNKRERNDLDEMVFSNKFGNSLK